MVGTAVVLVACGGSGTAASPPASAAVGSSPPASSSSSALPAAGGAPGADWPTFGFTSQRTGVGPSRTGIDRGNVGRLGAPRIVHLDGTVDSTAIEAHAVRVAGRTRDVIVVTTTYGRTIAIDPRTGHRLWEFTPSDLRAYDGSAQVTTASPALDIGRRYVYAASPNGFIHKLALSTGREVRTGHWPARVTYDSTKEKIASPLSVVANGVLVTTGGYIGDAPVYQGHVALIDRASGRVTHVFNALCSNLHGLIDPPRACGQSDAAIWSRAGVTVEPGSGRLLVATGNGDFNGRTDWGDSVLELSPTLSLLHNWTPPNQLELDHNDTDLGSSTPAVLPSVGGWRMAVQGGKDGRLHILNLNRLNGTRGGASGRLGGELAEIGSPGSGQVFTAPAVWSSHGRVYVAVADDNGTAVYRAHGGSRPGLTVVWHNGTAGTSPVLAGGLLYIYDELGGALNVYAPTSGARVATLHAAGGHWNSPIVVGGRIILPVGSYHDHSDSGEIYIWHIRGR
jgi:hypothetical protein